MIFLIGNSTSNYTVCFPIFILEDTRALKFPYSMLQALEFVLTFVSFYYVIKCCYVAIHIKSFHRNLTVLLIILMIQWFEGLLSNILIKPYETGFWPLGEHNTQLKQWWTKDYSKMIQVPNLSTFPNFFLGGFLKWHYILSMITTLLVMSIERSFACYFLTDYEKKSRNGLFFMLVVGQTSTNLVMGYLFFFNAAHFAVGFSIILSTNIIAMGIFTYVKHVNRQVNRAIEDFSNPSLYCLPARFQVRENVRCFQMITKVIHAGLFLILTACFVNLFMYLELTPGLDPLLNLIFESAINLNPVVIVPTLLGSVNAWRNFTFSSGVCLGFKAQVRLKIIKVSSVSIGNDGAKSDRTRKETDAYFDQLNSAWI
ncbi:Serpentine receptor class epsilon-45 [Caenorhabditis elegans]|uniref:Serpentine receptor class epsilon-45 n=1 Tax=Caenorhabditis elegans TaxID=6239 RepID=SRE45_CAEEL|nr:Serpentine receptor class epsilon-45 [Caenorhabditis elegans]O02275.3 RecName: Full=Serpentine receptor class epsilon-45; Short=Protein sre-45 [Caenorhabditis elegans]CAB05740.3 Serpentine receptor class epsilon-45 [Caenorhabditis elegans]|eukprot:NP_496843.2 Serpentine receptor class epsilon-45 [Caenorhabditis elegans]